MTVQKRWLTFLLLFSILVTMLSTAFLLQPAAATESVPSEGPIYLLRDDHGLLALYDPDSGELIRRYEIYTHLLPTADVDALRKGIEIYTDAELERLIEDFGG